MGLHNHGGRLDFPLSMQLWVYVGAISIFSNTIMYDIPTHDQSRVVMMDDHQVTLQAICSGPPYQ